MTSRGAENFANLHARAGPDRASLSGAISENAWTWTHMLTG